MRPCFAGMERAVLCPFLLFSILLAFGVSASAAPPASESIRREFQNPPKIYRPMVRWWWPGGDVTDQELRREVRALDEAGFGGAEIQPFLIGLNPHMPDDARNRVNDYLTPAFFSHVRASLEEAAHRGLWIDYTFGSGWPFGGGQAITPELASLELRYSAIHVRGPQPFHARLDFPKSVAGMGAMIAKMSGLSETWPTGWEERWKKRQKLVAVVAVRGQAAEVAPLRSMFSLTPDGLVKKTGILEANTAVVLTNQVSSDGTLDWNIPEGDWNIFTFAQMPADLRVIGGAGGGPQLVLDHLKRAAFEAHARRVGDRAKPYIGEFFGKSMRAIFCDSLEVQAYLYWTDDFLKEFRRRRGYDLIPFLPILRVPGRGDPYNSYPSAPVYDISEIGERVRRDYWQTVSDLMIDNFYKPFDEWAARNHMLSRVQAHGAPADVLKIYGLANIPETEDLYDNGRYDFLKMASSAGDVYGRKIVSSESFVWMGKAYQTTPEKIKRYTDELITAGINEIVYHGFPYVYMDRPEPGWHPFADPLPFSTHMNEHNPFWRYEPMVNGYMTRLQYISQAGTKKAPVAIYRGALSYDALHPVPPDPRIDTNLLEAGYDFDHINTDALLRGSVAGGQLITPGGAKFDVLVFQNEQRIPVELAEKLVDFARNGLPMIFVETAPSGEAGYLDFEHKNQQAQTLMKQVLASPRVRMAPDAARAVVECGQLAKPNLRFTSSASVPFIEKQIGDLDAFFLRNSSPEYKKIDLEFASKASPEIWDAWTGKIGERNFERKDGNVEMTLDLPPYGSQLIVFDPNDTSASGPATARFVPGQKIHIGAGTWNLHVDGIDGQGKHVERDFNLPGLVDWAKFAPLEQFSGRGTYTTRFKLDPLKNKSRVSLDLGGVNDVAEITVNGEKGPTLLMRPYQADITALVKPGENLLEITVVNTLFNSVLARRAKTPALPGMPGSPAVPMPSGLLGPVVVTLR